MIARYLRLALFTLLLPCNGLTAASAPMMGEPVYAPRSGRIKSFGSRIRRFLKNHGREVGAGVTGATLGTLMAYLLASRQAKDEIKGLGKGIKKEADKVIGDLSAARDEQVAAWQEHALKQRSVLDEMKQRLADHEKHDNAQLATVQSDYTSHLGHTKSAYDEATSQQEDAARRMKELYRNSLLNVDRVHQESLIRQSIKSAAERERTQEAHKADIARQEATAERVRQEALLALTNESERNRDANADLQSRYLQHNTQQADSFVSALDRNEEAYATHRQEDNDRLVRFERDSQAWRNQSATQHTQIMNNLNRRFDDITSTLNTLNQSVAQQFDGIRESVGEVDISVGRVKTSVDGVQASVNQVKASVGQMMQLLQEVNGKMAQYQGLLVRIAQQITALQTSNEAGAAAQLQKLQQMRREVGGQMQKLTVARTGIQRRMMMLEAARQQQQQSRQLALQNTSSLGPTIEDVTNPGAPVLLSPVTHDDMSRGINGVVQGGAAGEHMKQQFLRWYQMQAQAPVRSPYDFMQTGPGRSLTDHTQGDNSRALAVIGG